MNKAPTSQNALAYTDQGSGPAVVILHGLFGSSGNLGQTAKDLASDHRVICLDLPGHGLSARSDDYAHESMARIVLDTLISLDLGTFKLIGHSLGGKIGMQLASQLAGPVAGPVASPLASQEAASTSPSSATSLTLDQLVVVDIAPRDYSPHHDEVFQGLNSIPLNGEVDRRKASTLLEQHIKDAGIRAFLLKSFRRNEEDQWAWQFDLAGLQNQYSKLSLSPTLPYRVMCPTLFIKGANSDYILPVDEGPIREAFAEPEFRIIQGTGHWPHAEKPAAFNSLVRRFLTRASNT